MRKLAYLLLLASVATPSLAQERDHDRDSRRDEARAGHSERQQAREERREERQERAEQHQEPRQQQVHEQREDRPQVKAERSRDERVSTREARRADGDAPAVNLNPRKGGESAADREQRREARLERRIERHSPPPVSNVPREGTQPPPKPASSNHHSSNSHNWNSHWRDDHRYDWHKHRNRHRSLFRLGFYYDPFGWSYRPYSIGWRMWPSYYRNSYWLNDPWMYRLPPAYPGTVWIRYYNDALLVDTWTGEVVDVIYSFFW